MKIPFLRREQDTADDVPDDDGFRDMTYTPGSPCPHESCHHNHPDTGGRTP